MPDFEFEAKGMSELYLAIQELPVNLEKNVMRGAIRASAKPIVDDARRRVPVLATFDGRRIAGALKKSIRARGVNMRNGSLTGGVTVGGSPGKGPTAADTFYARFIEYGTAKMAPRSFIRKAIDAKTSDAIEAFRAYVAERLSKMFVGQSWFWK